MSDTPRTDVNALTRTTMTGEVLEEIVSAKFARQLERELAQAYERAAKVCEGVAEDEHPRQQIARKCAAAIRRLIPNSGTDMPKEGRKELLDEMVRENQKAGLYDL